MSCANSPKETTKAINNKIIFFIPNIYNINNYYTLVALPIPVKLQDTHFNGCYS